MSRRAVITNRDVDVDRVRAYLPSNYDVDAINDEVWITGRDVAGWTLDAYVIPRLASGLMFAVEVPAL